MKQALAILLLAISLPGIAAPVDDLRDGPVGRIEFLSSTPQHHWAIIRGRLGPPQTVWGDLLMPDRKLEAKLPVVVMSHGSEGLDNSYSGNIYRDIWAPPLNAAGYAVFIVDSFGPRGSGRVTGPENQLTWNSVANLSDALHAFKLLTTHPRIDKDRIYHMGWSRGGQVCTDTPPSTTLLCFVIDGTNNKPRRNGACAGAESFTACGATISSYPSAQSSELRPQCQLQRAIPAPVP